MTWTLVIIVVFGYRGGAAIDHIEGFKVQGDCIAAASEIKPFPVRYGDALAIQSYCVRKP